MRLYVRGPKLEPSPVGVAGELYIGGPGVARGYLGRPGLTAERFLPEPLHEASGRTVLSHGRPRSLRGDGQLEYLGRVDHQVKIRGYRVELGEIEAVLEQHPLIGAAAVVARDGPSGDKRLIAYVVGADSKVGPETAAIRDWLLSRLPNTWFPPCS